MSFPALRLSAGLSGAAAALRLAWAHLLLAASAHALLAVSACPLLATVTHPLLALSRALPTAHLRPLTAHPGLLAAHPGLLTTHLGPLGSRPPLGALARLPLAARALRGALGHLLARDVVALLARTPAVPEARLLALVRVGPRRQHRLLSLQALFHVLFDLLGTPIFPSVALVAASFLSASLSVSVVRHQNLPHENHLPRVP